MRLFWRTIFFLACIAICAILWQIYQPALWFNDINIRQQHQANQPKELRVSLTYALDENEWIRFPLVQSDESVKVISNAELPVSYNITEDERFVYGMEYEIFNSDNELILNGDIFHTTGQRLFYDEESKQNYVATSYYSSNLNPIDARLHVINLRGFQGVGEIRFRLKMKTPPIESVVLRLNNNKNVSSNKFNYLWQRMGGKKRANLASASIYQQEHLRETEKTILMQSQWTPVGPLGNASKEFITKKLYIVHDIEDDIIVNLPTVPPSGMVVYPNRYGVIRIPVFSGKVKLQWQALAETNEHDKVNVEWWGHPSTRYKQWQGDFNSSSLIEEMESGVIQVSTTTPAVFRIWINEDNESVEITPKDKYLRIYQSGKESVIYDIDHVAEKRTPFKVDLRTFADIGDTTIEYRLISKDKKLLSKGTLELNADSSIYDMVTVDKERLISNPTSYFFNLPPEVASIEFRSDKTSWVSAYTRPPGFSHAISYPYKQQNATQEENNIPAWYFMRPANWKSYITQGRSLLLNVQSRPPEIDPLIMAGEFRWNQFIPGGDWRGREILTPAHEGLPTREQALGAQYTPILLNQTNNVQIEGTANAPSISPKLMYIQTHKEKLNIKILLNGTLYIDETVYSRQGEINLPTLNAGDHKIKVVVSKAAEILLSHVQDNGNGNSNKFLKKMAVNLGNEPLRFSFLKENDNELIAVRVYTKKEHDTRQKIQINIEDAVKNETGPHSSWTITNRHYQLDRTDGQMARALKAKATELGPARVFFIPLGTDIPGNRMYQINIELLSGPDGYVVLTRTLPGLYESQLIHTVKEAIVQ